MRRLYLTKLTSIGAVEDGDNPQAEILFYKERNTGEFLESRIHSSFTQIADDMFGDGIITRQQRISLSNGIGAALDAFRETIESKANDLYSDDPYMQAVAKDVATAISKSQESAESATTQGGSMSKPDLTGLDESVRKELDAYIAELEAAAVTEPEGQVLPDDIPEPVAKALAEKDDAIAKEREAREAVEARIAKMQDDADTAKYAERAHELQAIIGGDAGEVLKTLANAAPEAFNDLDERLGRTSQQVKLNDRLFKELGSSNTEHNPTEQIATIAADIRKENPALTEAQSRAEAWSRNPQLLAESREVS